ncbi:glycosyl hydrolase [Nakamurella silvestris]|nr:glycosyl hydrolase [Nakamurella silvestris]
MKVRDKAVSRRSALKAGALGVGAVAAGAAAVGGATVAAAAGGGGAAVAAAPQALSSLPTVVDLSTLAGTDPLPVPAAYQVKPFALTQVALAPSLFTAKRDRMLNYARQYSADRMLSNFRRTAGLDTLGAQPPGSWDDATGNLRGHYSGHFLSLIAQAWAGTGEQVFKDKLDYLVAELAKCQTALAATGLYSHPGFLAAYPEDQFVKLEAYTTYPTIWAPYYTCHKIMAGLLACHRLGGNAQALEILKGMGDWVYSRLSKLPNAQLQKMWGMYIAGEYGGMNEVMVDLYALTGKADYLACAKLFDNDVLLNACAQDNDILNGKHANQHIPQFMGYIKTFDQTNEQRYYDAVENFWDMVVPHRMFSHGGTGQGELFRARDGIVSTISTDTNAETCACYNMLKISQELFFHTPDAKYMDYYERGLFNQILGSRRDADSATDPLVTYMLPIGPGVTRGFGNVGTCCGGTGLENHTKYQEAIYYQSADESALYVNLYVPSTLTWTSKNFTVTQATNFPLEGSSTLTVEGTGPLAVKLRVPFWVRKGFVVTVNGADQKVSATPGSYVTISRTWAPGDKIEISMPLSLRLETAIDDKATQSIFHGPILLVARDNASTYKNFGFYKDMTLDQGLEKAVTPGATPGFFSTAGLVLAPMYVGTTERYHAYFKRAEPKIAFGGVDSGVANPALADKTTFLDAVWAQAPFTGKDHLVETVMETSSAWVDQGRLSRADRQKVLLAVAKAKV